MSLSALVLLSGVASRIPTGALYGWLGAHLIGPTLGKVCFCLADYPGWFVKMTTQFEIRLKRPNKVYRQGVSRSLSSCFSYFHGIFPPQDDLTGVVSFDCKHESRHEGITLTVDGSVKMQLSSKNVGIIDAFYNSVKVSLPISRPNRYIFYSS